MLQGILFQLLALISNIVTQPGRQTSFHTVWSVCETIEPSQILSDLTTGWKRIAEEGDERR